MRFEFPHVAGGNTALGFLSSAVSLLINFPAKSGTVALTNDVIGVDQTWQDGLASDLDGQGIRAVNTVYTNTLSKPIMINITFAVGAGGNAGFHLNGAQIASEYSYAGSNSQFSFLIPAGDTYQITGSTGIGYWMELR